jgi:hypothetical protein
MTRARDAALHLIIDQHQIVLIRRRAQTRKELMRCRPDAALALDRLDQEPGGILVDRCERSVEIVEVDHGKAGQEWREPVPQLRLIGGADRRHRPPVEGVREGDEVVLLRPALRIMVAACGLDRAFDRFGTRIGEEDGIRERQVDEPLRQGFPLGRPVEVRHVHKRRNLLLQLLRIIRVPVAKQVDRDSGREVQISLAVLAVEIDSLAPHRPDRRTRINGH